MAFFLSFIVTRPSLPVVFCTFLNLWNSGNWQKLTLIVPGTGSPFCCHHLTSDKSMFETAFEFWIMLKSVKKMMKKYWHVSGGPYLMVEWKSGTDNVNNFRLFRAINYSRIYAEMGEAFLECILCSPGQVREYLFGE